MKKKAPYWLSMTSALSVAVLCIVLALTLRNKTAWFGLSILTGIMTRIAFDIFRLGMKFGFKSRPE